MPHPSNWNSALISPSSHRAGKWYTGTNRGAGGVGGVHGDGHGTPAHKSCVPFKQYTAAFAGTDGQIDGDSGSPSTCRSSNENAVQLVLVTPWHSLLAAFGQGHHEPFCCRGGRPHSEQELMWCIRRGDACSTARLTAASTMDNILDWY